MMLKVVQVEVSSFCAFELNFSVSSSLQIFYPSSLHVKIKSKIDSTKSKCWLFLSTKIAIRMFSLLLPIKKNKEPTTQ